MTTLLYNARIVTGAERFDGFILINGRDIAAIGAGAPPAELMSRADEAVDCGGDMLMPGVIDTHVHFRDPGLTAKGDIATESRAAVAGGVTSYIDMPNTRPATVTPADWEAKMERAAEVSMANYAFFIAATNDNLPVLLSLDYTRIPGIKLFLGSSTGNMLVDNATTLERLFAAAPALIAVHAEDEDTIARCRRELTDHAAGRPLSVRLHSALRPAEACVKASRRAIELARHYGSRLHLLHLSTADELSLLDADTNITTETCPHYLLFTDADMERLGSRIKCNPAIKSQADRVALLRAVTDGTVDTIATDHAPHLPVDKEGDLLTAASGMPGIQFSLPMMLELLDGRPGRVAALMSENPARIFGIVNRGFLLAGFRADIVRVRRCQEPVTITDADVISRCGWTPYAGMQTHYKVIATWVNGHKTFDNGTISDRSAAAPLRFLTGSE
ncbi:MAG: amidohydrolase family protein [Muribaculaceae bacterium]|nr:amidohydrolase family protein [Muribaculaceae bacterium]